MAGEVTNTNIIHCSHFDVNLRSCNDATVRTQAGVTGDDEAYCPFVNGDEKLAPLCSRYVSQAKPKWYVMSGATKVAGPYYNEGMAVSMATMMTNVTVASE